MEKKPLSLDDILCGEFPAEPASLSDEWPVSVSYGLVRPVTLDEMLFID